MGLLISNSNDPVVYIYKYSYEGECRFVHKKYVNCSDVHKYGENRLKHRWYSEYEGHKQHKIDSDKKNYNKYIKWKNKYKINIKCPICKIYNSFNSKDLKTIINNQKTMCVYCMDDKNNVLFTKCNHSCLCLECCENMINL